MRTVRAVAVGLLAALGLLAGAGTAAADLVVDPAQLDPGAREVTLTFRVTADDPAARPARLQVFLPTGRPLVGVRAPAPPGWTSRLTGTRLPAPAPSPDGPVQDVVSAVEWTTTTPPAASVELPVLVERMPDGAGPVRFRAVLTDSAGRTEEWSDSWAEGGPKPAHDSLQVRYGPPPPPVVPGSHGDHHGDEAAVAAAASAGPATPSAVAATLTGAAAAAAALTALMLALARRQRARFERLPPAR